MDTQNSVITVEYPVGEQQPSLHPDDIPHTIFKGILEGEYHVIYVEVDPEVLLDKIQTALNAKMVKNMEMEELKKHLFNAKMFTQW